MANKYAKEFAIPPGFAEVLRDFAREVIREQPQDINAWAFQYFTDKMMNGGQHSLPDPPKLGGAGQDAIGIKLHGSATTLGDTEGGGGMGRQQSGVGAAPNRVSNEELGDRIALLFDQADADGNGTLERREMEVIFKELAGELGLGATDVLLILGEADENDDGVIEYREFVPMAVDIITALLAKEQVLANKDLRQGGKGTEEAREYLLKGMPQQELEQAVREVFAQADGDGNGTLDRAEFLRCLKESGLGFTRRELNIILTMVDQNGDGLVQYEEFIPICLSMLVELVAHQLQETPPDEAQLGRLIAEEFAAQNAASPKRAAEGRIHLKDAMAALQKLDLGLTKVQIHAVLSSVGGEGGGAGEVDLAALAESAAGVVIALSDFTRRGSGAAQLAALHTKEQFRLVAGVDAQGFRATLEAAFAAADPEGAGALAAAVAARAVQEALPGLSGLQGQVLLSIGTHPDGRVAYGEILAHGFATLLQHRSQQAVLDSRASGVELAEAFSRQAST
mmetsp:Transcript_24467/g.40486  ORF Transcript_24467/g.40486 Transcript_24467/m.40486 type:complete len:509 (-) Transcript_24467:286-1812(-)